MMMTQNKMFFFWRFEMFWDPNFLRGIQTLKLGRSDDDDDAKQNGFFWRFEIFWDPNFLSGIQNLKLGDLMMMLKNGFFWRSEIFWDPKFLRGIQTLKLGRSDDDDDAKQNGFFCYGSSWDAKKWFLLLPIIMRSEIFWDPTFEIQHFLGGFKLWSLGDPMMMTQNKMVSSVQIYFCYGSSWDLTSFKISFRSWDLSSFEI